MQRFADFCNGLYNEIDIGRCSAKIDDACAQQIVTIHNSVGNKNLPALLDFA